MRSTSRQEYEKKCFIKLCAKRSCATGASNKVLKTIEQGLPWLRIFCSQYFSQMEKLEPNEIDFSQGFSQEVVSRSCSVFNSLPASGYFCHLLITFANSLDPDQA